MRRRSNQSVCAVLALGALLASTVGCRAFEANVPGVLDLRSDGAQAATIEEKLPAGETTRDGFGGILTGEGVKANKADVTVEDRHWWILGLFKIANPSMKEEMAAALGKNAMRKVYVGEQLAGTDVVIGIVGGIPVVVPFIGYLWILAWEAIAPPMTGTFSGTRIAATGGSAAPMAPEGEPTQPPTDPAPAPAPAPAPSAPPATGGAQ